MGICDGAPSTAHSSFVVVVAVSLVFVVLLCLFTLFDLEPFVPFRSETRYISSFMRKTNHLLHCPFISKYYFCGRVPWLYQYWPGGFMLFVVLCPGTPEGSTGSGSGFKASQKTGQRLKVSSDRLGEAGNQTCDPWSLNIPHTVKKGDFF